jgi:3'-phosphoadenosine 5'-phosphosulfate sulfotransferase (PAPS reductase)/FAD synthetase
MSEQTEKIEALVDSLESLTHQAKDIAKKQYDCKAMLALAMAELDAEEFQHGDTLVTYKSKTLWVEGVLNQLNAVLPDFELDVEDFLNKPQKRTWDKRKIVKLAKRGGVFKKIIDSAQTEGMPVIQVKEQG